MRIITGGRIVSRQIRPFSLHGTLPRCFAASARVFNGCGTAKQGMNMPAHGKRPARGAAWPRKKKASKRERTMDGACTKEDILEKDISSLVSKLGLLDANDNGDAADDQRKGSEAEDTPRPEFPGPGTEVALDIKMLASTGEGLGTLQGSTLPRVFVVPVGTVPGDVARAKVYRHMDSHTVADLISIATPSSYRDESNIKCKYFGKCAGCQLQMLPYDAQLAHKRDVVVKAFANFSNLTPEQVPEVGETVGSPLQYGYRTKLTPHYDQPRGEGTSRGKKNKVPFSSRPDVGFQKVGSRSVLDIEECPIATEVLNKGLKIERERMNQEFGNLTTGATILLRESTKRVHTNSDGTPTSPPPPTDNDGRQAMVVVKREKFTEYKTCVTDSTADTFERVGKHLFKNPAGAFFQNNNSILPLVTDYVREKIPGEKPIRFLVDAYCGSGLFTITLASLFTSDGSGEGTSPSPEPPQPSRSPSPPPPNSPDGRSENLNPLPFGSVGIDVSTHSVKNAYTNARLSRLPKDTYQFVAADASDIFSRVRKFDPEDTAVVIDPPRKGCDASFLRQLMEFGPRRIAYVSCNVHSQARDVGMLVRGIVDGFGKGNGKGKRGADGNDDVGGEESKKMARYEIESVRGFDFFPQTGHVEGVAILNRVCYDAPAPEAAVT
ncbi:hypothetical protein MKZ38_003282 [Zalerion maritima]|uniref:TRAM domain-containing protein n=1 Tax=Zalerion maritima TaxID=339359 RepID=A0AAD5RUN6_9PEZI|nr:hypothetical protein MKZ38_003282 [Zalerion maritima]